MIIRTLVKRIAFAAVAAAFARYIASRRARVQGRPAGAPRPLQTWEGEGGAVPVGGSRIAAQADEREHR